MIVDVKQALRPLYFSRLTRPLRDRFGRGLSSLSLPADGEERLRELLARLPSPLREETLPHARSLYQGIVTGAGLAPLAHWRLLSFLAEPLPRARAPRPPAKKARREKLRVLFVTGCFPSVDHGGGLRIFDMLRELSRRHEVSLYSHFAGDRESLEALLPSLAHVRLTEQRDFSVEDIAGWVARVSGGEPFDAAHLVWPRVTELIPAIRPHAERLVFELIECSTRSAAMDVARVLPEAPERAGRVAFTLLESWHREAEGVGAADGVVAVTPEDAAFAHQVLGGPEPRVIPTCVSDYAIFDRLRNAPEETRDGTRVPPSGVFVGFFGHPPNIDGMAWYLRHVHGAIREQVPGYVMYVAGSGDTSPLERLAAGDPSVVFLGRVDDLVRAFRGARICLSPLVSGAGIRGKLNQYSAASRPTVSTSIGISGTPYVDGDSVLVADEPERFAAHAVRLLTDDGLHRRITTGAERIVAEHFTWEKQLPALEALYGG